MNLEDYRTVFTVGSVVLMLIVAAPALGLLVPFPIAGERFSEFWLLGPNHLAEEYPFDVRVNQSYHVFVGLGNHLGSSSYYLVYLKFRNQTQSLPNATISEPSPLAPIYEFRAFVKDRGAWEAGVSFSVIDVSSDGASISLNRLSINDQTFNVGTFSKWDSEHKGFYYQLFFELWLYNVTSQSFQFHNRFVAIWLNITTS